MPARLEEALAEPRRAGFFSEYPFGTDLTADEIVLARALKHLQARTSSVVGRIATFFAAALRGARAAERRASLLQRLSLDNPRSLPDRVLRRLVTVALQDIGY